MTTINIDPLDLANAFQVMIDRGYFPMAHELAPDAAGASDEARLGAGWVQQVTDDREESKDPPGGWEPAPGPAGMWRVVGAGYYGAVRCRWIRLKTAGVPSVT